MSRSLSHHSNDFKRRLKTLVRDKHISTWEDTIPVEKRLSKEELTKLHNNIHYTNTIMKKQAEERWED